MFVVAILVFACAYMWRLVATRRRLKTTNRRRRHFASFLIVESVRGRECASAFAHVAPPQKRFRRRDLRRQRRARTRARERGGIIRLLNLGAAAVKFQFAYFDVVSRATTSRVATIYDTRRAKISGLCEFEYPTACLRKATFAAPSYKNERVTKRTFCKNSSIKIKLQATAVCSSNCLQYLKEMRSPNQLIQCASFVITKT